MSWSSLYREEDLQGIWEGQRFRREGLLTEDARRVEVEFPGVRSVEGGPDFRGARLRIGGRPVVGDVEIHLSPSGWRAHGHDRDGAYAGVALHVVLRRDPYGEAGAGPPLLVLEPYLCATLPVSVPEPAAPDRAALDRLGDEAFEERRRRLARGVEHAGPEETLYREILVALGYKRNQAAMAGLARLLPLRALPEGASAIEGALRGAAASLPAALWRLRGVRPANHPWRRLSGMARFLAAARGEGLARGLEARTDPGAMAAWLDPDGSGHIGADRAREIVLNVFLPFLGADAWRRAADGPPPGLPGRVRREIGGGADTLRRYLGALRHLKRRG
jgi:hypothetical protein